MNKFLKSTYMKRCQLGKWYLKNRSEFNAAAYARQRNCCVSVLRKEKKYYYANWNEKNAVDNKQFWKTFKPFLSDKIKSCEKITLVVDDETFIRDEKSAEILNSFYFDAVKNLKNDQFKEADTSADKISHLTLKVMVKYRDHASIIALKVIRNLITH